MKWIVKYFNCNSQKIEDYNVLKHAEKTLKRLKKEAKTKEEFSELLKREMMYYYWSKCEWEMMLQKTNENRIILYPWCGCKHPEQCTVDVTEDSSFDWKSFADEQIKSQIFEGKAKIDVYDQLKFKWNEFVDYCLFTKLPYERQGIIDKFKEE